MASVYFHSYDYRWELEKNVELKGKEGKYLESEDDSCPKTRNQKSGHLEGLTVSRG